jgi:homoserine O-acetyltransferase
MRAGFGLPASSSLFHLPLNYAFEGGGTPAGGLSLAYNTYGKLAPDGRNAVLVGHSLTSNSCVHEWWSGIMGAGPAYLLDTQRYFIVCANLFGSVYGSTGPASRAGGGGAHDAPRLGCSGFPITTIRDNVRAQRLLLDALGVRGLAMAIGGSLGGMLALETALSFPHYVERLALVATCAAHPPWAVALGAAGRAAVFADAAWADGDYGRREGAPAPVRGLDAARQLAMLSYKSPASVGLKFGRRLESDAQRAPARRADRAAPFFAVESYLEHQGEKFTQRFDAAAYVRLTQLLDSHDVARGRATDADRVLSACTASRTLVVGIDSDHLYPVRPRARGATGTSLA